MAATNTPDPDIELVQVFSSADPGVIAVAKSFWVREEDVERARELLKDLTTD